MSVMREVAQLDYPRCKEWQSNESNEPLTIDQLWKIDAPVWLSYSKFNGEKTGYWCLCKYGYIITPSGYGNYVNDLPDWVFYRHPPEEEGQ